MKTYSFYKLLLLCLIGIVLFSCKKEVGIADTLAGEYDGYYSETPDMYGDFPRGREDGANVERLDDNFIKIVVHEKSLTPTYGTLRSTTFDRCALVKVDTTGNLYGAFLRIIDTQTNTEIGQVFNIYWYNAIPPYPVTRLQIRFDYVNKYGQSVGTIAFKRLYLQQ
jgi:hypothetical protein